MLQRYYSGCHTLRHNSGRIKIGLCCGTVEVNENGDPTGTIANKAQRITGQTNTGEIWVDATFKNEVSSSWGKAKTAKYFTSCGRKTLTGITPKKQELFSFNQLLYNRDNSGSGLENNILDHLSEASVINANIKSSDLENKSWVIWPVVPRKEVLNAIHRGQIEIIRLLTILGWNVHVLIVDCGAKDNASKNESKHFKGLISAYTKKRNIKDFQFSFMSNLYKPKCNNCDKLHKYFQSVISDLTLKNLLNINNKNYAKPVQKIIVESATLDFLKPALQIASVFHLYDELNISKKCIIVAGYDEKIQWERAHDILDFRDKIGVLFNPILETRAGYQERQGKRWPYWDSWKEMADQMKKSNLAEWTTKMHIYIPAFPDKNISIGKKTISQKALKSNAFLKNISREELAKQVHKNILSI